MLQTWMNFKDIMLWNVSYKKTNTVWVHLHEAIKVVKIIETENRMVVSMGWRREEGNGELVFNG